MCVVLRWAVPQTLIYFVGVTGCNITALTPPGSYTVRYSVEDLMGGTATAQRTVIVEQNCPQGLPVCEDFKCPGPEGTCERFDILVLSNFSSTVLAESNTVNTPPRITLWVDGSLNRTIDVTQGHDYQRCGTKQVPSPTNPCEMGASAVDNEDADMTMRVFACPPVTCIESCENCAGHELDTKGIRGCVNTSVEVGTMIRLPFVACDRWTPAMGAVTERLIRIVSPCRDPTKPNLCNGQCYSTPCSVVASVNTTRTIQPPRLLLFGPGSTSLADGVSANKTIYLAYGERAPLSLAPCLSASSVVGCAAVAMDDADGDLTANITAVDVTRCTPRPVNEVVPVTSLTDCIRCSPADATIGTCLPGRTYTIMYTVANSAGARSTFYWQLVVESWNYTSFVFTYTAASTGRGEANDEAAKLMTDSTAASKLAQSLLPSFPNFRMSDLRLVRVNSAVVSGQDKGRFRIFVNMTIALGYDPKITIPDVSVSQGAGAGTLGKRRALASDAALNQNAHHFAAAALSAPRPEHRGRKPLTLKQLLLPAQLQVDNNPLTTSPASRRHLAASAAESGFADPACMNARLGHSNASDSAPAAGAAAPRQRVRAVRHVRPAVRRHLAGWLGSTVLPWVESRRAALHAAVRPVIQDAVAGRQRGRRLAEADCVPLNTAGLVLKPEAIAVGITEPPGGVTTLCLPNVSVETSHWLHLHTHINQPTWDT